MTERPFTRKEKSVSSGHPAKCGHYSAVAPSHFARLVRASRGAHCRPLHPRLASSLMFRRGEMPCQNQHHQKIQPPPVDTDRGTCSC
jgi:hypothetical protein